MAGTPILAASKTLGRGTHTHLCVTGFWYEWANRSSILDPNLLVWAGLSSPHFWAFPFSVSPMLYFSRHVFCFFPNSDNRHIAASSAIADRSSSSTSFSFKHLSSTSCSLFRILSSSNLPRALSSYESNLNRDFVISSACLFFCCFESHFVNPLLPARPRGSLHTSSGVQGSGLWFFSEFP